MIEFEPLNKLTIKDVKRLRIHSTLSGLRRSIEAKEYKEVQATEHTPTLYYILETDQCGRQFWSIHALSVDVNRFLLLKSTNNLNCL